MRQAIKTYPISPEIPNEELEELEECFDDDLDWILDDDTGDRDDGQE